MKKIISGIIIVSIIIVSLIVINQKYLYKKYTNNIIKEKVLNELKGEFNKNTHNSTIKYYELCKKPIEELNRYDITKLIDTYLDIAEEGVEICSMRNEGKEVEYGVKGDYIRTDNFERGKDIVMECNLEYGYSEDYGEDDILDYKNGDFRNLLIEKLKKILDYEEKDGEIVWQINSINDDVLELPYNFYLNYKAYHRIVNDRYKKAIDVIIDNNFSYNHWLNAIMVRYETIDGELEERKANVLYGNGSYAIDPTGILLLKNGDDAKISLCNHTCDRIQKEREENDNEIYCMDDLKEQSEPIVNQKRTNMVFYISEALYSNEEKIKGKTFEEVQEMFRNDNNLKEKVRKWMFEDEEGKKIFKEWYDKLSKEW